MAKVYGVFRPNAAWHVVWTGDNMQEIKDAFPENYASYFFVNEENNNLCFGPDIEYANQYPVGTLMLLQGGVVGWSQADWDATYSEVDSAARLKYTVVEDIEES